VRVRGLTETKEGRFVVIAVLGGTLMIALAVANLALAGAADSAADDARRILRRELSTVSDEEIADYPDSADEIEALAARALRGRSGTRVLGTVRPEGRAHEVVVVVEAGWAWQARCVHAELRGGATVLTYVRARPC